MPTPPKPAAKAGPTKITAWSFSRFNDYRKCPKYAFFKHVRRLAEPGSAALDRGSAVHEQAQVFAQKTARVKCPPELQTFEQEFRVLQKNRASLAVEQQWCFNSKWQPTEWFGQDAWCRIVVDACYVRPEDNVLVVIDHKTGKINEAHLEQLSLYALGGLLRNPDISGVEVQLWYLDHGVQKPDDVRIYTQDDARALKSEWEKKVKPMLSDGTFREKPGKACTWCHYSKGKGGPCKF